jgi:hypothetical protein
LEKQRDRPCLDLTPSVDNLRWGGLGQVLFKIEYLSLDGGAVVHATSLTARNAREADASAMIGMNWARSTHGAEHYRVLDDKGALVAAGPQKTRH